MKQKVLIDVKIICDPPRAYWYTGRTMEHLAREYEDWVKDFHAFIRDHRSQDPVTLNVEREYQDQCSFCHSFWEEDEDGMPICCDKAQKEFEEARIVKSLAADSSTNK